MYTAWSNYGATGEGRTIMVAIAGSAVAARDLFREKFDSYYEVGMAVARGIPPEVEDFIPEKVKQSLLKGIAATCFYQWSCEWHVNCS